MKMNNPKKFDAAITSFMTERVEEMRHSNDPGEEERKLAFLETLNRIRTDVLNVKSGCILWTLRCRDLEGLEALWDMYKSGTIKQILEMDIKNNLQLEDQQVEVKVLIREEDYEACKAKFEDNTGKCQGQSNCLYYIYIREVSKHIHMRKRRHIQARSR